ncbi:uncharacterized protein LOC123550061 [Mercenaria mercenaria]|uniref:uncharacterized protein LOC123550061 n=1 Tax=Mercenaria mercenaria TaxID=6596 RepID=UPI00234FA099|nr:uncharacterized protein LOC123550061 [Mercenaria mercenaria]
MWSSKNKDNPWRFFRRPSGSRCRSSQSEHDSRDKQTTGQTAFRRSADDRSRNHDDQETEVVFYNEYDDNANANIFDKFLFYGLRNTHTCDKQTQTDMVDETSVKHDTGRRSPVKKIIYSRSCETLGRKSTLKPHASRSFDISNNKYKNHFDYQQTTFTSDNLKLSLKKLKKSNDNISPIRHTEKSIFPEGQGMTEGFYIQRYSGFSPTHEGMSQNELSYEEFPEIPNHEEKIRMKRFSDEEFCLDLETNLRNMSCKDRTEGHYKNQWSPFHQDRESDPMFYDYRQPDEVSLVSERSCYSTTSDEADDDYEIIDWSQYTDDYREEENGAKRRSDAFNTPPTTPTIDLSALDGYHTAPNSPEVPSKQEHSYTEERKYTQFYDKDVSSDFSNNHCASNKKRSKELIGFVNGKDGVTYQNTVKNSHYGQSLCCKCGKSTKDGNRNVPVETAEHRNEADIRKPANEQLRQNQKVKVADSRILRLETPPFISVNSLHYEADPETGKAKVIGRGSFGQVYKARFSDPMFCHLPIVIKEFDEEFTNSKEIVEEAKRLHYLQDTGYVPICYGLLCFGSPIQPKYGIVQEYVGTGLTLEQMLWDQYELPLEFWFRIVIQCCEGLARFHEKGILLNDIKTNNILLEFFEHSVRIRYIDFGLATDMRGKRYKNTRSLDDFVYLAPEVRRDGKVTNIASDIYSLGYILEQIKKYTSIHELTVVARLCMDRDPDMRIPPRAAASLIKDHMVKLGFDQMVSFDI